MPSLRSQDTSIRTWLSLPGTGPRTKVSGFSSSIASASSISDCSPVSAARRTAGGKDATAREGGGDRVDETRMMGRLRHGREHTAVPAAGSPIRATADADAEVGRRGRSPWSVAVVGRRGRSPLLVAVVGRRGRSQRFVAAGSRRGRRRRPSTTAIDEAVAEVTS